MINKINTVPLRVLILTLLTTYGCTNNKSEQLPILGDMDIVGSDTVYHRIPNFSFVDQDSNIVSSETVKGKIYVADFFFTRCPTICPILSRNVLKVAKEFANSPDLYIISHTIDSKYDTPEVLRSYAEKLDAPPLWRFVNGSQDDVYRIAGKEGYFSFAAVDSSAPGGFDHSGACTLVDTKGRVRGVFDGTDDKQIDELIAAIKVLLKSKV